MATPHINSNLKDIASIVLMPGDPKRAKYIADNYLKDVKLVNDVRGMTAFTGYYEDTRITIFPSGMGIPSVGIYSHELFSFYNVDYIIRVGTMGSYDKDLNVGDIFLITKSYSNSYYMNAASDDNYPESSKFLNDIIIETARVNDTELKTGIVYTTDIFYDDIDYNDIRDNYNVKGVEMESFALFKEAKRCGKEATAICTVSDSFVTNVELSSEERQNNLDNMIKIALKASLKIKK